MSIRSRLLLATLSLVAIGLLASSAATFALLRSSLLKRVDEQLIATRSVAARALFEKGFGRRGPGPPFSPHRGASVPPATIAELLEPSGEVIQTAYFGFDSPQALPELPEDLPGSIGYEGPDPVFLTAGSANSSLRYRILAASASRAGGTVLVGIPLQDVDETLNRLLVLEGLVGAAVLVAVAAIALWLVRIGLRPLESMARTADQIAGGDLSKRVEPSGGQTEIGRLGSALNAMLGRIESAFAERRASEERLRRFVADASHELRTPLTSIRGYAELFRRGADVRPDDLAKTMTRIEEESARMSDLVEELLLLARLDQGRPLQFEKVDLARIVRDTVEDAAAAAPAWPIRFKSSQPVVIDGDDGKLRQVAANLLNNAVTHTPAGTPVHVAVEQADGRALLEVADEGPGLTAGQTERVFDRFYRADKSRSREKGGSGLGLSIVAAIVQAHRGRVEVASTPGRGSRFIVSLPAEQPSHSNGQHEKTGQAEHT